ncbi:MAG: ISAs1 family transposase [Deltaproteobacteria bacterium]|nr:ISAs1 family transposase [Deltaproteobacteria bacterium]
MTIRLPEERVYKFLARQVRTKKRGFDFSSIADPRQQSKVSHRSYSGIIWQALLGLLSNQPTLRDVEEMRLGPWGRRLVPDVVSDTTLDTELRRMEADALHAKLVLQIRDLQRGKMLRPSTLPFGVATIDGKNLATVNHTADGSAHKRSKDNEKWQPKKGRSGTYYLMPALRATLTSAESKPCIFQKRLPPGTGESSSLDEMIDELHAAYGRSDMFELIDVDAGLTSLEHADHVDDLGYAYMMGLKGNQPELFAEAQRVLEPMTKICPPEARTPWERCKGDLLRRSLWRTDQMRGYTNTVGCWRHLRQTWLVRQETKTSDGQITIEDRYFVSSLLENRVSPQDILTLVRGHWGIENDSFNSLDVQWREDDGPWCTQGHAVWVLGVLRLMAYNLAQLLRRRHLRPKTDQGAWRQPVPWRTLFKAIERALARVDLNAVSATTGV